MNFLVYALLWKTKFHGKSKAVSITTQSCVVNIIFSDDGHSSSSLPCGEDAKRLVKSRNSFHQAQIQRSLLTIVQRRRRETETYFCRCENCAAWSARYLRMRVLLNEKQQRQKAVLYNKVFMPFALKTFDRNF